MRSLSRRVGRRFAAVTISGGLFVLLTASLSLGVEPASAASWTVTDCSGSPSDTGSLPYAVANSSAGDTITFSPSLSCPPSSPILSSGIDIGRDLTITGPGASTMAVSGGGTGEVFATNSGTVVTISGLTMEDGDSASFGGGIYNQGTLTVANSSLSGNNGAYGPYVGDGGGAIYNLPAGTLTVENSTISNNIAELGGGIFNSGTAVIANGSVRQ